jgi:hypothetical protein
MSEACKRLDQRPVDPKPPLPRAVSLNSFASLQHTRATGATTNCAIRIAGVTVNAADPRLMSATFISPR